MIYLHEVSFITPIAHVETARAVSRAFDPDVGGAEAFKMLLSAAGSEPTTHAAYNTPCSESFLGFLQLPVEQIHAMVVTDYSTRWNGIEPPTLEAVTAFMASLIAVPDVGILQVIEENNLKIIHPRIS